MTTQFKSSDIWLIVHRIATLLMPVMLAIAGYFLSDVFGKFRSLEKSVHALQLWRAETTGSRFSTSDWTTAKTIIDAERIAHDRRITRLEETIPPIREGMIRIEQKLDKLYEAK
jgi:hypothetical protein